MGNQETFCYAQRHYAPLPFWFWNESMAPQEIDFQLRELSAKGMRGVIIHPRFGLEIPYLSEEWFSKVRYAVERAGEVGLEVWIYDEMNWSSGRANNRVVNTCPDLAETYLELIRMDQVGPTFTCLVGDDERYFSMGGSNIYHALAVPKVGGGFDFSRAINMTPRVSFGQNWFWDVPAGEWSILFFVIRRSPSYIDTLNPEATQQFIEETHERYARAVGEHFGRIVKGFYIDEPAMHYFSMCTETTTIPWTSKLPEIFAGRFGYDLRSILPDLFSRTGPRTDLARYHFWNTVSGLYTDSFFRKLRDWCHNHGLLLIGHGLAEESLRLQAKVSGNLFDHLRALDVVGIDDLFHNSSIQKSGEATRFVALKIASSAAHLSDKGSRGVLCESFGGCGWGVKLSELKKAADLEFAAGVTLLNPHGYHYSLRGDRKRDWPASQFYHHPWWAQYSLFSKYAAKLGRALSQGVHAAPVAVLFPHSAIWAGLEPGNLEDEASELEERFNDVTNALISTQWDFDYVDECSFLKADVQPGRLIVGMESYRAMILPGVRVLRPEILTKLRDFVESGGLLIAIDRLPDSVMGMDVDQGLISDLEVLRRGARLVHRDVAAKSYVDSFEEFRQGLDGLLTCGVGPDFHLRGDYPRVFYLKRKWDGQELFFVTNQGSSRVDTTAELAAEAPAGQDFTVREWRPGNGCARLIPVGQVTSRQGGSSSRPREMVTFEVPLTLEPGESLVFTFGDGNLEAGGRDGLLEVACRKSKRPGVETIEITGEHMPIVPQAPNVLPLSELRFRIVDNLNRPISAWRRVEPGNWEPQLSTEIEYPIRVEYESEFVAEHIPEDLSVLIDGTFNKCRIEVNGNTVPDLPGKSQFDHTITSYNISKYAHRGRNSITIRMDITGPQQGLRDPIKLTGHFGIKAASASGTNWTRNPSWIIVQPPTTLKPGSWKEQGYPFFTGAMTYKLKRDIQHGYSRRLAILYVDAFDDAVSVKVNGETAGVALWPPYAVNLTGLLRDGANDFEISIYSTSQGLWGDSPQDAGLGRVWLEFPAN